MAVIVTRSTSSPRNVPGRIGQRKVGAYLEIMRINVSLCYKTPLEDKLSRNCPYLDTIDRSILDFDFEKLCSVSLLNNNVYACLVCGKYFQGMAPIVCDTHSVLMLLACYVLF